MASRSDGGTLELVPLCHRRAARLRVGLALVALWALSGCAGSTQDPLSRYSAISFSQPDFRLEAGDLLYWRSELVYLYEDAKKTLPPDASPVLQQEIQAYLEARGYRFAAAPAEADYGLVAVLVLGEGMTAEDVLGRFKLTPAFQAAREYEEGTIVVAFYERASERIQWRGAIQGNVDPALPAEERRRRIREVIGRLFARLPQADY